MMSRRTRRAAPAPPGSEPAIHHSQSRKASVTGTLAVLTTSASIARRRRPFEGCALCGPLLAEQEGVYDASDPHERLL